MTNLRKLMDAGTPGPWMALHDGGVVGDFTDDGPETLVAEFGKPANAEIAVALHNAAPAMLDLLERVPALLNAAYEAGRENMDSAPDSGFAAAERYHTMVTEWLAARDELLK